MGPIYITPGQAFNKPDPLNLNGPRLKDMTPEALRLAAERGADAYTQAVAAAELQRRGL